MTARFQPLGSAGGGGPGGDLVDVDGVISTGSDGESLSRVNATMSAQSLGSEGESARISNMAGIRPTGTDGEALTASGVGSSSSSTGSEGESTPVVSTGAIPVSTGAAGASMLTNVSGTATGHTGSATAVINAGTTNWTNPTNAQGAENGTEAAITSAATATQSASHDATLRCSSFGLGVTPTGWTRSAVHLIIRHRWDLTVGALSTASIAVTLQNSTGSVLATPISRAQGSGDQATLLIETFDVTAAVAALSDTDLQGCQVWCRAVCNLLIVTGGNASWQIDNVHLRVTYTRTGIA